MTFIKNTAAIPEGAWQALEMASAGMVNDALALAGIQGSGVGVRPARGVEDTKIIGPASTVFLAPQHPDTPPKSMYVEERWIIRTVGLSPAVNGVRLVKNNMGNIPARQLNAQHVRTPNTSHPVTFFFKA
jgi:hypothetical protein